jgi:lipopolysaccharide/colanic/teichoic acid biosynthesis glycosyltransferase
MDSTQLDSNLNGTGKPGMRATNGIATDAPEERAGHTGGANGALDNGGVVALHRLPAPAEVLDHGVDREPRLPILAQGVKRAIDLVGSLMLIVLLTPLWLMIAILIKADSPGPILFRQRRIGRGGRPFGMVKFRTMVDGADAHKPALLHLNEAAEGLFKIYDDPRVTRIGRWLRTTSLDELPQLLHVLSGKMSLVGPRPLVPEEDALIQGEHRRRLAMRPGMTGPWQVGGASSVPIHQMVELDGAYVEDWSLWLDAKLLAQTASHVIARRGL